MNVRVIVNIYKGHKFCVRGNPYARVATPEVYVAWADAGLLTITVRSYYFTLDWITCEWISSAKTVILFAFNSSLPGSDNGLKPSSRNSSSVDLTQSSRAQYIYELEHLATFTASSSVPGRLMTAQMGVTRVREMARAGAIWPLRVKAVISNREITVTDARTSEEMEHFPIALVSEPTSATASERRSAIGSEPLDNIVLFTVLEDPVNKTSPPEMHIFQCLGRPVGDAGSQQRAFKASSVFLSLVMSVFWFEPVRWFFSRAQLSSQISIWAGCN